MIKNIQKFVENILQLKIIPEWRLKSLPLTQQLQELFDFLEIDTVIDVGANEGQYGAFLRNEVGFTGTILSFEPALAPYKILEKVSDSDANWNCFFMALGNEEKTEKFNIMMGSQFNSLLKPDDNKLSLKGNKIINKVDVKVKTLDNLWQELQEQYGLLSVYIKLDTQGFDLNVLKGSKNILHNIKGLQSELSIISIYKDMPDYKAVIQFLENKHFVLSGMHPINLDSKMRLIEVDGIFINKLAHKKL